MLDSLHILIVDDRPDGVLFLSEFLHTRNHMVEVSNDGQEALEAILRRHRTHDAYDLVFAALAMAKLDGVAMLRSLRRRGVDVPTALYTASGNLTPEISQQAKIHGCLAILEKPLSLQRIERLLDEQMRRLGGTGGPATPASPSTASHRREDGKPFFGTSRVMRVEESDTVPTQPSPPPTNALERIRRPSSGEFIPAPMIPADLSPPHLPSMGGQALTPTGQRIVPMAPPAPIASVSTPPPPVPPPVAPPSTAFFRSRPVDTRSTSRRDGSSGYRRATDPPTRTPTNTYNRRQSGLFHVPEKPSVPTSTTARIRRTVGGVMPPVVPQQPINPLLPPPGPASHPVACAHCRQLFLVVAKPQSYTVVCVHCGQLNRIDPF